MTQKASDKRASGLFMSASRPSSSEELRTLQSKVAVLQKDTDARTKLLIDAGIYTEKGNLRKAFGG